MRGVLLLVASIATVVAAVYSAQALELSFDELRPLPLLVAAVAVTPVTIVLNAAELRAMAPGSGADRRAIDWPLAIRTVVLATAANLLPVPAGAVIRIGVLRRAGATTGAAAGVTLAAAAIWIGVSVMLAAAVAVVIEPLVAVLGLAGGLALSVAGVVSVRRTGRARWVATAGELTLIQVAMAVLHAVRLWLVLAGISVSAEVGQTLIIGASSPLAAAAGFFPGGIGLAELLSALLAPLAGIAAAAGLLAVALGRLLGLAVTIPLALALGLTDVVRSGPGHAPV